MEAKTREGKIMMLQGRNEEMLGEEQRGEQKREN